MNSRKALIALAALVFTVSFAANAAEKLSKAQGEAMMLTTEQASYKMKITGTDPLDPVLWISSEPFLRERYGGDSFFRAMIDKQTGETTYQLYLYAVGRASLRPNRLTYLVDGSVKSAKVERIGFDVSCQRYGCTHYEDAVAEIPRAALDRAAAEDASGVWRGRVFGDTVEGVDVELLRTEIAGLLMAVDRAKANLGV